MAHRVCLTNITRGCAASTLQCSQRFGTLPQSDSPRLLEHFEKNFDEAGPIVKLEYAHTGTHFFLPAFDLNYQRLTQELIH